MPGQINAPIGRPRSRDVLQEHFFKKLLLENVRKTGMKQSHCEGPKVPPPHIEHTETTVNHLEQRTRKRNIDLLKEHLARF